MRRLVEPSTRSANPARTQVIVKDLDAAKGWTAIVPLKLNGDSLTDMLSYNPTRPGDLLGRFAAKGWTAIVPLKLNGNSLTDMLSYNANTGRAIYSVATQP